VRADAEDGRRFAAVWGFRETGEYLEEYQLHVPDVAIDTDAGPVARLEAEGIRITSLAELGADDPAFLRALQQLWVEAGDRSADPERLAESFPSWPRDVLNGAGLSAETHWIAVDNGRPVGMAFLKRLSEDAAENDYTCVASTHRGRGIATALKLRSIAWARQHGVRRLFTSCEIENTPMIAINKRLGYQVGVRRLAVARALP
jgi:GNAT superfamily N-acetyltransferase